MDGGQPDPWQVWRDNHIRRAAPQQPPNPNLQPCGQASSAGGQAFATTPDGCGGTSRGVFVTRTELPPAGGQAGMVGPQSTGGAMGSSMPGPPFSNVVGMNQQCAGGCMSPMTPQRTPGQTGMFQQQAFMPGMPQMPIFAGNFQQPSGYGQPPSPSNIPNPGLMGGRPNTFGVQQSAGGSNQFGAADFARGLDATLQQQQPQPAVGSAFEALGKSMPMVASAPLSGEGSQDALLRALQIAVTGEKKSPPTWAGSVDSLRPWLKSLALWEMDNHLPRHKWGVRLLQCFSEGSAPRKIAETIETSVLLSEAGYGAILSAIMTKYAPFLEAVGPAAIDHFFYQVERSRNDSFSTYIAAKELARQELESQVGERVPDKIAGRILLKHANLTDQQRENLAIKHNALLNFDQVAAALRPLDRPEALMNRVAKTFLTADHGSDPNATWDHDVGYGAEEEEEELIADFDMIDPESDGEGGLARLYFDPNREYEEEEAQYIWAYNMAYYKDVRKELQSRRKGRNFFKPKGSSKGFQKGKSKTKKGDHKPGNKGPGGTPEQLQAKTRCWKCLELGHISRDCPQKDRDSAAKSSQFFVCQGPLGPTNSVFMQQRTVLESTIAVFAGIRTDAHEAIVDTAAEEAVLGSIAMNQLKQALSLKGLQPVQVHGETASCAGIGGSANIVAVWDIPIGIAKTNGLIRATEIRDSAGFETPFLLPISYQELVGAVVNVKTNMFHLDNGKKAPMRRLPSKHRTVSVVDFALPWQLPEALRKELRIEEGNPFLKPTPPRRSHGLEQGPGVAVWLKTKEGDYKKIGNLPGARTTLVHPAEVLESTVVKNLTDFRITDMQPIDSNPFNIRDVWKSSRNQRSFSPWFGNVYFEEVRTQEKPGGLKAMFEKACLGKGESSMRAEVHAVSRPDHSFAAFHRAMKPTRSTNFLSGADMEPSSHPSEAGDFSAQKQFDSVKGDHVAPPHREAVGLCGSGGDTNQAKEENLRSDPGFMGSFGESHRSNPVQCDATDGPGLCHQEEHREQHAKQSSSCGTETSEVRCSQDSPRNRQTTQPFHHMYQLAKATFGVCPRRRSTTPTWNQGMFLVDLPRLWKSVGTGGVASRRRGEHEPTSFQGSLSSTSPTSEVKVRFAMPVTGRDGGSEEVDGERRQSKQEVANVLEESKVNSEGLGGEEGIRGGANIGGKARPCNELRNTSCSRSCSSSVVDAAIPRESRELRDPFIGGGRGQHQEQSERWGLQRGDRRVTLRGKPNVSTTTFSACIMISWFLPNTVPDLEWLGPQVELEDITSGAKREFIYLINSSCKELGGDVFGEKPADLNHQDRNFLSSTIKRFLDHVGEVYSPPRVTLEARKQGMKAQIALDLTNGWDFRKKEHRHEATLLVQNRRPGVLILCPPCHTQSLLRSLTNAKRDPAVVAREEAEGDDHLVFSVDLAELQHSQCRGFLLEQPYGARSWKHPRVVALAALEGVYFIYLDQCAFGLRVGKGPMAGELAKKPTFLLTNIAELADFVGKKCTKNHIHGPLIGGVAAQAAVYPPDLVRAIVSGIKHSLGIKTLDQHGQSEQGKRVGRALGQVLHQYAVSVIEAETMEGISSTQVSFPVTARASSSRVEDPDEEVEGQVQRELQGIGEGSKIKEAATKVEDLMKGGEDEFSLPAPLRREIHRLHRNLGHPAKEVFVRALRHSGVRFEVLDWVKAHFRCPTCEARTKPSPARPGHLARALEFNVVIGIDLIFPEAFNETYIMLNCLCWGTNFQQVALCQNKGAEEVRNVFCAEWIKHYGCPQLIILDRGKEFFGTQFQEHIGSMGIAFHFTDPESPWQNSRTERAGGVFKEKLKSVIQHAAATKDELPLCIAETVSARNRFMDRFGFSPMQRVFGKTMRMPASLMSSDALDADLVQAAATDPAQELFVNAQLKNG